MKKYYKKSPELSRIFNKEFKDVLISIQIIDFEGNVRTIPANKVKFDYRGSNLPKENIFLSATFKGNKKIFGITMLLNQATPCFKLWFGFKPKIDKNLIKKIDKIIS